MSELRIRAQGKDHWEAVDARWRAAAFKTVQRASAEQQRMYVDCLASEKRTQELEALGKHADALPMRKNLLEVSRKLFGDAHPYTAVCYSKLAANQARYDEAEGNLRRALDISRKALGEDHPITARIHNNLAVTQEKQGKYPLAEEGHRKALDIRRRVLGESHPDTAQSYNNLAANQLHQAKNEEAAGNLGKALDIWRKALGEDHPDTAMGYGNLAAIQLRQGKYALAEEGNRKVLDFRRKTLGEDHPDTATAYGNLGVNQSLQAKYDEAEGNLRKALDIRRRILGEDHSDTARGYYDLAYNQGKQEKYYEEAEGNLGKALDIWRKALGENNPDTARGYNGLAVVQISQAKYDEAEGNCRKALDIRRRVLGESHPDTAECYGNLATTWNNQGKYSLAEEGHRKALDIRRRVLGESHPDTAQSYGNLASTWNDQGKYSLAEEGHRKALDIFRRVLGESHPDTAKSYSNLAVNQEKQGKHTLAEEGHRKALDIWQMVFGEGHHFTAMGYNNLAVNQEKQGKHTLAEEGHRKALDIFRRVLGESHPDTAKSYNNLAVNQEKQGKHTLAEEGYRKALDIWQRVFGEGHHFTALVYSNTAAFQARQGKYALAEELAGKAASIFIGTRTQIASAGLDRVTFTSERSPLPLLAALFAHNGKSELAWQYFEASLSRGTGDDLTARLKRPVEERQRQAQLLARLRQLEAQLLNLTTNSPSQGKRRAQMLEELRQTRENLTQFGRELEEKYGPAAGEVLNLASLQKALSRDAAYLAWLDLKGEPSGANPSGQHWGILLRSEGNPIWIRLPGTGANNSWTKADSELGTKLHEALVVASGDWKSLAHKLRTQRLAPLADHLKGVRHLIVLPSGQMDRIPVEVIAEEFTVSYALSASLFAATRGPRPGTSGLVALGDPIFRRPEQPKLPLPPGGVLLTAVLPRSPAALSGLKSGDVLLQYGKTPLKGVADLQTASADVEKTALVKVWRLEPGATQAVELALEVPTGKLGVLVAPDPAPKAVATRREADALLAVRDNTAWPPLPGTRYEVNALKALLDAEKPTVLLGSDASEARLAQLSADGTLGKVRFLHLATHGEARSDKPLASRVILSRDRLSEGQYGELSAEQVLTDWDLHAELVTLSACQTGLGKYEISEGYVGFAQALLLAGARSVCLSRWCVNDLSTALLMERFYQNLLGRRPDLRAPLGKAAALAEAKQWLRTLPREEALKRAKAMGAGEERGPGAPELPRVGVPAGPKDEPPYAHPYYWAGFVLIGERD